MRVFLISLFLLISGQSFAQVYIEKQSRHRFAQLNLGIDINSSFGGSSQYINSLGNEESLELGHLQKPRIVIGGTHFWGHADFYIAIPLFSPAFDSQNQKVFYDTGVETVFKYYPLRIEHNKIRPFAGFSIAPFYFEHKNNSTTFGNGPELNHTSLPLISGITFLRKNQLFEIGLLWNYSNTKDYFISRNLVREIETPPLYLNVSYRIMLETTLSAEKSWESGHSKKLSETLSLDGFFIGLGMSSAFWIKESKYNQVNRPYISRYSTSIMPDFAIGYYFHNTDINITANFRGYSTSTYTYGANQVASRRSFGLEATKFLFDYHGFVPFIGPIVSSETLRFQESFERNLTLDITENKLAYGITFGWDIRPNRIQSFILRTSLRWYPNLELEEPGGSTVAFDNIEFNFIQLIVYLNRFFG